MLQWTWGCTYHFKTVLWFPSWLRILWYIPRVGTAGSYSSSSFSFFEETFHSGGTNLHPQFLGCSFYFSFFFFVLHHTACGILIPYQGSNPRPLQWKLRVLTTGLSGKSMVAILIYMGSFHPYNFIPHFSSLGLLVCALFLCCCH